MANTEPDDRPGNSAKSDAEDLPGFPWPVLTGPMPLSVLARQLAVAQHERWVEAGCPGPWMGAAPVRRSEPPPALSPKWEALKRAWRERSLSDSALGLVLEEMRKLDLRVSGIVPPGQRVEIDGFLLPHLVFELEHDRARTADGRACWLALEISPAAMAPAKPAPAPPRAPNRQIDFLKWYRTTYPDGHPSGKKLETLAHEAAGALACRISTRTIRRALAGRALTEHGRRTKAAR